MKKLRLGFCSTFGTAENYFTWVLGQRYDVDVVPPDQCDYLIFGDPNFGNDHYKYRNCKRILYTGENFRPNYFTFDHAITFDHENSPKHYRLPLWVPEMYQYFRTGVTNDVNILNKEEYSYRLAFGDLPPSKFASFIQSNPNMPIRNKFVEDLMQYKTVDCAGKVMNNIGYELPRNSADDKRHFLAARKFNVAIENGLYPGYCTEKILDAFYAWTIPIYLGSTTVDRDFNTDRFINCHDYTSLPEVIEVIKEYDNDDSKWLEMVTQPVWKDNIMPACANVDNLLDWWENFVE